MLPDRPNAIRTEVGTKLTMLTAAPSYRVYDTEGLRRCLRRRALLTTSTSFGAANRGRTFSDAISWADAIVGVRGGRPLSERWSSRASPTSAASTARRPELGSLRRRQLRLQRSLGGTLGYRYMSILYKADRATLDIDIQGPLFGITYKF